MVSGKLKKPLAIGAALAVLAGFALPGDALPQLDPGPFYPLEVGHSGERYADGLPSGATYSILGGRLPAGLTISASGKIDGVPSETGSFSLLRRRTRPAACATRSAPR